MAPLAKSLGLANLRRKKTHSTQTADSHFRRENDTQARGGRRRAVAGLTVFACRSDVLVVLFR